IAAIDGLGRSGKYGRAHIPLLEKLVAEAKADERGRGLQYTTVKAIFQLQPDHKHLVGWLSDILSDERFSRGSLHVTGAIKMLGQLGPRAMNVLPLIRKHENDSDEKDYREIIREAIMRIDKR